MRSCAKNLCCFTNKSPRTQKSPSFWLPQVGMYADYTILIWHFASLWWPSIPNFKEKWSENTRYTTMLLFFTLWLTMSDVSWKQSMQTIEVDSSPLLFFAWWLIQTSRLQMATDECGWIILVVILQQNNFAKILFEWIRNMACQKF